MSHRKDISDKNPVAVGPPEGSSLSSVRIYDHLSPRTQAVLFLAKRVCPFHVTRISCQIRNSIPYSIKLLKRSPFCKRIKELLLNFLRSEDDYVEVPRLIMLVSLCNCYYSLCFMLVFFLLIVLQCLYCCLVHLQINLVFVTCPWLPPPRLVHKLFAGRKVMYVVIYLISIKFVDVVFWLLVRMLYYGATENSWKPDSSELPLSLTENELFSEYESVSKNIFLFH